MVYLMRAVPSVYCVMTAVMLKRAISSPLELQLKTYRKKQATAQSLPCYCIFGDTLLKKLAHTCPRDFSSLSKIKGMGPERCSKYGHDIISIMQRCCPDVDDSLPKTGLKKKNFRSPKPCVIVRHNTAGNRLKRPDGMPATRKRPDGMPATRKQPDGIKSSQGVSAISRSPFPQASATDSHNDVYILELAFGRVYVGKSSAVDRRFSQHVSGAGAAFTKAFPPTGNRLPRLGNVSGSGDAAERDETLRYMFLRGIHNVRGWRYSTVALSVNDFNHAEAEIRENFDLCRRCGNAGHFIKGCRFEFDRMGRKL